MFGSIMPQLETNYDICLFCFLLFFFKMIQLDNPRHQAKQNNGSIYSWKISNNYMQNKSNEFAYT